MIQILLALNKTGLGRFWENPTGVAFRPNMPPIHYGFKGSADITGILVGGKRIEIEVKTGKAVQQDNQKRFQAMIAGFGGFYFVARSIEEAVTYIQTKAADCNR